MRIDVRKRPPCQVALAATVVAGSISSSAWAQLRVVTLNASNSTITSPFVPGPRDPWMSTILSAIGSTVSDDPTLAGGTGIIKPIDVLALQEVNSAATTSAPYAALLNSIYPGANYQYAALNGATTGAGTQGLIYNANAVQLIGTTAVGVSSGSSQPRQALRYQLRPVGYGSSADVYLYNSHYKSGQGNTNGEEDRRNDEAINIRANADALGANKNIIYLGDFNVYTSSEPMYQTLLSAGNGKANDPINKPGAWNNNSSFKNIGTQSPFSSAQAEALSTGFNGTSGGMDDRFDQQLVSTTMLDGHGVAYITNSYQAFGNNGTHTFNSTIYSGANQNTITQYLSAVLDHLPVVADYQLPARLGASVSSIPEQVITGGSVTVTLNVANTAPVSYAIGADTLNYLYSSTGAAGGAGAGSDAALGTSNNHTISLSTAGIGAKSGNINVTSTSESVANNNFNQAVNYTVLDHADGSFSPSSSATGQSIDFGYVPVGSATRTAPFSVNNRAAVNRAGLDLDAVNNSGDTARLTTDAAAFANLPAGGSNDYTAALNSDIAGNYAATHAFILSDQDLPGAASLPSLVLTTTSRVFSVATFPVTGFMYLPADEPLTTGPFSIQSSVTLTKTGPGAVTIDGSQNHGTDSELVMNGGSAAFNTDAGATTASLGVIVQPGAAVNFNATQHLASLQINGASATVSPSGNKVLSTGALTIAAAGILDLADNKLITNTAAGTQTGFVYNGVQGFVQTALNGGGWDGTTGITTSQSDAPTGLTTIGVSTGALARSLGPTDTAVWAGQTINGDSTLAMYTYTGDANLDGRIDGTDYFYLDSNVGTSADGYGNGDFNYDGIIDGTDYFFIDSNIVDQGSPFSVSGEAELLTDVIAIPEPSGLFALGAKLLLRRRRRGW